MKHDILAKLKPLLESSRLEPTMFFRVCAFMGVSFAAAMAVALSCPAIAQTISKTSPAPQGYADIVGPEVANYLRTTEQTRESSSTNADPFDDHYFVQKSGEPFHKFDKAPDPKS